MDQFIIQEIIKSINNVRFGSVEITVHNSKVVQIEVKEKVRFDGRNSGKARRGDEVDSTLFK